MRDRAASTRLWNTSPTAFTARQSAAYVPNVGSRPAHAGAFLFPVVDGCGDILEAAVFCRHMELQCSSCTYLHLTRLCVLKRNVCCDVASFVVCAETRNCRSCQATVPQSVSSSGLAPARALCCGSTDVRQMPWQAAPGATRHEYERNAVGNASFYGAKKRVRE